MRTYRHTSARTRRQLRSPSHRRAVAARCVLRRITDPVAAARIQAGLDHLAAQA